MYKLIAFDLDGTLTEHRTPIEDENFEFLLEIQKYYGTVIVGAGTCERILKQLKNLPVNIIGNYGLQKSVLVHDERTLSKFSIDLNKEQIDEKVAILRKETGYVEFTGDGVEFHESGVVTFPLLGTKANIHDKITFDPNREKRKKIHALVKRYFKNYTVFIGGSSSFDIVPEGFDKYKALKNYAEELNISLNEVLYVGDDFSEGGNDEQVYHSEIRCIEIDHYKNLKTQLSFLIENKN